MSKSREVFNRDAFFVFPLSLQDVSAAGCRVSRHVKGAQFSLEGTFFGQKWCIKGKGFGHRSGVKYPPPGKHTVERV